MKDGRLTAVFAVCMMMTVVLPANMLMTDLGFGAIWGSDPQASDDGISSPRTGEEEFIVGNLRYIVMSEPSGGSNGTAEMVGFVSSATHIEIPLSVVNDGKTYDVTKVRPGALVSFSDTGEYTGHKGTLTLNAANRQGKALMYFYDLFGTEYQRVGPTILTVRSISDGAEVLMIPTTVRCWNISLTSSTERPVTSQNIGPVKYSAAKELFVNLDSPNGLGTLQFYGSRFEQVYVKTSTSNASLFANCTKLLNAYVDVPTLRGTFYGCAQLDTLVIGGSVASMGTYVAGSISRPMFEGCDILRNVTVATSNATYASEGGLLLNKAKTDIVLVPRGSAAISIPSTVTSAIEEGTFSNMQNLESMSLGPMTSIRAGEFVGNLNMITLQIPAGVTSIDFDGFQGCVSLRNITVNASNPNYRSHDNAIYSKDGETLHLYARSAESVNILSTTRTIGMRAFNEMTAVADVAIPAGVTSIHADAFKDSYTITSISVASGNSVYSSGNGILLRSGGTRIHVMPIGLSEAVIPSSVTAIENGQFAEGTISNIRFSGGSLSIGSDAFRDSLTLKRVIIESNGTVTVGQDAFAGCAKLRNVWISASQVSLSANSFEGVRTLVLEGSVVAANGSLSGTFGSVAINGNLSGNPFGNGMHMDRLGFRNDPTAAIPGAGENILQISSGKADAVFSSVPFMNLSGISGAYGTDPYDQNMYVTDLAVNGNPVFMIMDGDLVPNCTVSGNVLSFTISSDRGLTSYDITVTANDAVIDGPTYNVTVAGYVYIRAAERTGGAMVSITFDSNGGTAVPGIPRPVGTTILPEHLRVPWKNMSTFAGWHTDPQLTQPYVLGTPIPEGPDTMMLYAKWIPRSTPIITFPEGVSATVNGIPVQSGHILPAGSTAVLTYQPEKNYAVEGWYVNGELQPGGDTLTLSNVQNDLDAHPNSLYGSPSNVLTNIVDIGSLVPGEDPELLWRFTPEGISMGMGVWSMPSVPLIVNGFVYVYCAQYLHKVDADTGQVYRTITIPSLSAYYRYVGYGGGYILEYNGDKVYDLDLNYLFDLGKDISASFYNDGYFYGISGGRVWKFSIGSDGVSYDSSGGWADGVEADWFRLNGTTSAPVFANGHMYFVEVPMAGSVYLNARCIASIDLTTGVRTSVEFPELYGRNLDDGWLTYSDGWLFLTTYLQDTNGMVTAVDVSGGTFGTVRHTDLGYGGGATSAFVVVNGRGYVNVSNYGMTQGRFMVFNVATMLDGTTNTGKLYEETSVGSHGSIVVNKAYANAGNGYEVYVYLIPYMSSKQGIYVFTDHAGKTSPGQFYKTPFEPMGYGSQGVRLTADGKLIWYSDSGSVYCFAPT